MILHIDMDAFYAAVEQRDHPDLRGQCVIVGGSSNRGVVTAASYEARKFGVHSAMPIFKARRNCPQGIFVKPRMQRYKTVSKIIMSILREFSPLVEPVSIDEAYVDVAGCETLYGTPEQIAVSIKEKILADLNMTCSVGVAPNKFLAKIASDLDKPDGLTVIAAEDVPAFVNTLAIAKVPGVGIKTQRKLQRLGIRTVGDLHGFSQQQILNMLGKFGKRLLALSEGVDDSAVVPDRTVKSVSTETTFPSDTDDMTVLNACLIEQSETVAKALRNTGARARTVTIKIKHADFRQATRSATLAKPTQSSETIYEAAKTLLSAYRLTQKLRLIGVGASGLLSTGSPVQLDLFASGRKKANNWDQVDKTIDKIREKFGKDIVQRATVAKKHEE